MSSVDDFFFLVVRRPPRSTLFPTRRSSDLGRGADRARAKARLGRRQSRGAGTACPRPAFGRSEEHTSELQSRLHLVCRLLLEKKKFPRSSSSPHPAALNRAVPVPRANTLLS